MTNTKRFFKDLATYISSAGFTIQMGPMTIGVGGVPLSSGMGCLCSPSGSVSSRCIYHGALKIRRFVNEH